MSTKTHFTRKELIDEVSPLIIDLTNLLEKDGNDGIKRATRAVAYLGVMSNIIADALGIERKRFFSALHKTSIELSKITKQGKNNGQNA